MLGEELEPVPVERQVASSCHDSAVILVTGCNATEEHCRCSGKAAIRNTGTLRRDSRLKCTPAVGTARPYWKTA